MKVKFTSKSMLSWFLFDWANSAFPTVVTTFIFATYFTEKVAVNHIVGTSQWGYAISIAAFIIALLSPVLGAIADVDGRRKIGLGILTITGVIAAALMWYVKPSVHYVYIALFLVIVGEIGLEVGMVFYNAMLHDLVPAEQVGRASGVGWGIGYLGGLTALVVLLFVVLNVKIDLFGLPHESLVRLAGPFVALWSLIFSLPLFLFTKDRVGRKVGLVQAVKEGMSTLKHTMKSVFRYKNTFRFILARMVYIDGLNTVFAFGGIYAAGVFHMNMQQVIIFGIAMNVSAGIGAILLGFFDDWKGSKVTVLISLVALIISAFLMVLVKQYYLFWLLGLLLCFFVGSVQSASRSLMLRIAPKEIITEMFGFYALSGKITAFVGPWLLGSVTLLFDSQRIGMSTVILFFLVGGLLLLPVKERQE